MRKILKWIGIVIGGLIGLLIIAAAALFITGGSRLNKNYDIEPKAVAIVNDEAAVERGEYLYSFTCSGCHGEGLGGTAFFDQSPIGYIPASNLTSGQGGVGSTYSDSDYVRAIRHGVNSSGKPLAIMPAQGFWHYSDEDLGAIIAYIRSSAAVDSDLGEKNLQPMGRILFATGALGELAADIIDHDAPHPEAPEPGVTADYGEYLVNTADCRACHGQALSGGPGAEPGSPPGPNLTAGGELVGWTAADFIHTMRTGVTPAGYELDTQYMPWQAYGRMTDDDLTAVFMYLQSLPAG
ncbi:MAG: c-type cytochrome [Candidatus Promineifilaceae bacterium]|nr:c-type cytochrome [Candidatus Promineifilaceae bacterium]